MLTKKEIRDFIGYFLFFSFVGYYAIKNNHPKSVTEVYNESKNKKDKLIEIVLNPEEVNQKVVRVEKEDKTFIEYIDKNNDSNLDSIILNDTNSKEYVIENKDEIKFFQDDFQSYLDQIKKRGILL